jgi:hypothetical protein
LKLRRGILSAKDSFTVVETVRRYLPNTLAAYLRLSKFYAQTQTLADGKTASQILLAQLPVLDTPLKEVVKSTFAGAAETLVTNEQFLQNKFAERLAFRALVLDCPGFVRMKLHPPCESAS